MRQIQQISSPVPFYMNDEIYKWKEEVEENTKLLFWLGKWKDQATNCLGEVHHCFVRRATEWAKFCKDLSPKLKVHFVCFHSRENSVLKWKCINLHCVIDFSVKLMLNSNKYFRKRAQIRDSFVVYLWSIKNFSWEYEHMMLELLCKFHLSTETFEFSNKFFKKWPLFIILLRVSIFFLCSFITVVHRTVVKQQHLSCTRIASEPAVSTNFAILTLSSISPDKFWYEASYCNFFFKLVLPVILKEIQSFFSFLLYVYC